MMTRALGTDLTAFIVMQVTGIAFFIFASNIAGRLAEMFGPERMIFLGSALSALGLIALTAYGVSGGKETLIVAALFVPVNFGLGLRGSRWSMVVNDGKVEQLNLEEGGAFEVSSAEHMLGQL